MLESLLYLVVYAIVIGMVAWLLIYLIDQFAPHLPDPIPKFLRLLVIAVCVIAVIYLLLGLVGGTPGPRLGRP
jgi:uncharacterized membrane protein YedE/YeeE